MQKRSQIKIENIVTYIVIFDLVLGGTGRVITIGGTSFRIIMMAVLLALEFLMLVKKPFVIDLHNRIFILIVVIFVLDLFLGIMLNNPAFAIDEFSGYMTIMIIPFFILRYKNNYLTASSDFAFFHRLLVVFSLLSIGIWTYAMLRGIGAYAQIRALLDQYWYGSISFIGHIPRIFLKSSIFVPIGLLFSLDNLWNKKRNSLLCIIEIIIFFITILTTFTVAFYVFSAFVVVLYLVKVKKRVNIIRIVLSGVIIGSIAIIILHNTGAIDILMSRFSGEYSVSIKIEEAQQIIEEWVSSPIFGYGFGHTIDFNLNYIQKTNSYRYEVMWLQLLCHTGLIGTIPFIMHVFITEKRLQRSYLISKETLCFIIELGVLFICLVSFTNPFMNNSIGLIFYSMAVGVADGLKGEGKGR